jgi:ribosome production factor 1
MYAHRLASLLALSSSTLNVKKCCLQGHGRATSHKPELILSGFGTHLGHRLTRVFAALFAQVCSMVEVEGADGDILVDMALCCSPSITVYTHVSLFIQDPAYRGRRVVTFHNQRDFIFFR